MNIAEIKEYKEYLVKELYGQTRREQRTDKQYRDDTFPVPDVKKPHRVLRLGTGARVVDAPAEQAVSSNPQAFIETLKGRKDIADKISKEINGSWIDILKRQNPHPFKETLKNLLGRGESYIKLQHNESWVTGKRERRGLPVLFLIPDSMVIYGSPEEDENGVPKKVIVSYERQPKDVILSYEKWTNPKNVGEKNRKKLVQWFEYWDKDIRYFEADGEAVLSSGIQENIYGITPFIRRYSGFGTRSPEGELADLIVSNLRLLRGLIYEECVEESDIASRLHLSAHVPILITSPGKLNKDAIAQEFFIGAYDITVLDMLPDGTKIELQDMPEPSIPMFQHLANIKSEIAQRNPFIIAGFPGLSSGRQDDRAWANGMKRYETVIENTESMWATAFEMAFEMIKTVPTLEATGLTKSDMEVSIKVDVDLKAKDPIEQDRLVTLGSKLMTNKEIDPITNLVEFKGYTQDRAKEILVDVMKWDVLLNDPNIRALIGSRAIEKAGMLEDLGLMKQQVEQAEQAQDLTKEAPKTTQQRQLGEVQTERGREEEPVGTTGARVAPERFTRGE